MGMYTEIVVSARVRNDPVTLGLLEHMVLGRTLDPDIVPDHDFFRCSRWSRMFRTCSHYHVPRCVGVVEYDAIADEICLIVRADFKNYENEADLFFAWMLDKWADREGNMVGYTRYEEDRLPRIYCAPDEDELDDEIPSDENNTESDAEPPFKVSILAGY